MGAKITIISNSGNIFERKNEVIVTVLKFC